MEDHVSIVILGGCRRRADQTTEKKNSVGIISKELVESHGHGHVGNNYKFLGIQWPRSGGEIRIVLYWGEKELGN